MLNYIEINGESYPVRFGMGFLRSINKTLSTPVQNIPGAKKDIGLSWHMANILDGDLESLCLVLKTANQTETPKLSDKILVDWIEDEGTDIDQVLSQVIGFLETANVSKKQLKTLMEEIKKQKENENET